MVIKHLFYYHRRFLATSHKYKRNKNDFFVGRVERDIAPLIPSGEDMYHVVSYYKGVVFDFQSDK
jgi:hypothetical protein